MTRAGVSVSTAGDELAGRALRRLQRGRLRRGPRLRRRRRRRPAWPRPGPRRKATRPSSTKSLAKKLEVDQPATTIVRLRLTPTRRELDGAPDAADQGHRRVRQADALFARPGTIAKLLAAGTGGAGSRGLAGEPPTSLRAGVQRRRRLRRRQSHRGGGKGPRGTPRRATRRRSPRARSRTCSTEPRTSRISSRSSSAASGSSASSPASLLLINIFVMLADERKSELGMLRAIGPEAQPTGPRLRHGRRRVRAGLRRSSASSSGIGVGRVVATLARGIFGSDGGFGGDFSLRFSLEGPSLVTGFLVGALHLAGHGVGHELFVSAAST